MVDPNAMEKLPCLGWKKPQIMGFLLLKSESCLEKNCWKLFEFQKSSQKNEVLISVCCFSGVMDVGLAFW